MPSLKNKVKEALESKIESRDNDNSLIAYIWEEEAEKLRLETGENTPVLQLLSQGSLPCPQAIGRWRRKLQEEFEHLRGETYEKRHNHIKKIVDEIYGR